jgi:triphosphatase
LFEGELSFAATTSDLPLVKQALLDIAGREHAAPTMLTTTYYDTAEIKLKRQGLSLCVRKQRGRYIQTVRAEDASGGVSPVRGEWEDVITGECPDLQAQNSGAHLAEAIGEAELRPLFAILVRRAVVMLAPDDLTEIEVALDEGEIQIAGGVSAEPVCEVKLEHKRGDPAAIYEIGLGLLDVAPLRIEVRSKVERGYNLLEGTVEPRAAHPPPVVLKAEMTVEEALQRIGRECLAMVFRNQPAALAAVPWRSSNACGRPSPSFGSYCRQADVAGRSIRVGHAGIKVVGGYPRSCP